MTFYNRMKEMEVTKNTGMIGLKYFVRESDNIITLWSRQLQTGAESDVLIGLLKEQSFNRILLIFTFHFSFLWCSFRLFWF